MKRKALWTLLLAAAVLIALLLLLLAAEARAEEATIRSLPVALWYALTTLTTVGYGDTYPVTAAGRAVGAVFQLLSLGLAAFLIGLLVSALRGSLWPRLRLWALRDRDWYVFSGKSPAALALASALAAEDRRRVLLFPQGGEGSVPAGAMETALPPEWLLRRRTGRGQTTLLCMEEDQAANEALVMSAAREGCRVCCLSAYEPDRLRDGELRFDPWTNCARLYWQRYPLTSPRERIVLIGGGRYAAALLEQALLVNVLDIAQEVSYRVYGDMAAFRRSHLRLGEICASREGEGRDSLCFPERDWTEEPESLLRADRLIFCGEDEGETLEQLARLKRYYPLTGRVFARLSRPLREAECFGGLEELYSPELVLRQRQERTARGIHERYRSRTGGKSPAWEELSAFVRRSNLAGADHLETKLRILLGTEQVSLEDRDCLERAWAALSSASGEERERLRKLEHERWLRFHLTYNWQYAPERDNALRRHPLLLPYGALSPEERAKDDDEWLILGDLLKEMER